MDKLKPGNEVIFTTPAGRFTYRVREIMIVGANDTWIVNDTPDATFTLMACHPKGSARQRIVAKGNLVSAPAAAPAPARPDPAATTTTTRQKFLGIL
jgi:LPXTG-site transpeptidase (sortase) family protein